MNSEMTFENDKIKDSYYLIKLFNDDMINKSLVEVISDIFGI